MLGPTLLRASLCLPYFPMLLRTLCLLHSESYREGDPNEWSAVISTALGTWGGKLLPRDHYYNYNTHTHTHTLI